MNSAREKKTKSSKQQRPQHTEDAPAPPASKQPKPKKGGKHKYAWRDEEEDSGCTGDDDTPSAGSSSRTAGLASISDSLFVHWDELLATREELTRALHARRQRDHDACEIGRLEPATSLVAARRAVARRASSTTTAAAATSAIPPDGEGAAV